MKKILFILLVFCIANSYSQRIAPEDVISICSNKSFESIPPVKTKYNNLKIPCSDIPLSNTLDLYYVKILSGTTFTFVISPLDTLDYDFASWKNPNFDNVGIADRGSQNTIRDAKIFETGLSFNEPTEICEEPNSSPPNTGLVHGMVRHYNVKPGDGVLIAVNRWGGINAGYGLTFGGDAILNCDVETKSYEACDSNNDGKESFDLIAISDDLNNEKEPLIIDFFEKIEDALNSKSTNTLASPLLVNKSNIPKKIYARYRRANGVFVRYRPIELIVNEVPKLPTKNLVYTLCDNPDSKNKFYDLTFYENDLDAMNKGVTKFKYYENIEDAEEDNSNTISNILNYVPSSKTIYIRITINDRCPKVIPLFLETSLIDIDKKKLEYSEFCAEEQETGLNYDLQKLTPELIDSKNYEQYEVSFYNNEDDAKNHEYKISNSDSYLLEYGQTKTLYARIENEKNCFVISEIILNSKERIRNGNQYNDLCEPYILEELPEPYSYFTEPNGTGELIEVNTPESHIYGKRTIYIYANKGSENSHNTDFNNCAYETSFTVYSDNCLLPKGISPNGDNLNDNWDLTSFGITQLKIYNRYGKIVYSHGKGYTNQWHGQSNGGSQLPDGAYWFYFDSVNGNREGWVVINR